MRRGEGFRLAWVALSHTLRLLHTPEYGHEPPLKVWKYSLILAYDLEHDWSYFEGRALQPNDLQVVTTLNYELHVPECELVWLHYLVTGYLGHFTHWHTLPYGRVDARGQHSQHCCGLEVHTETVSQWQRTCERVLGFHRLNREHLLGSKQLMDVFLTTVPERPVSVPLFPLKRPHSRNSRGKARAQSADL